jgi:hypothetical protein
MKKINLKNMMGKHIYEYTKEQLERRTKMHKTMFWAYSLGALATAILGAYTLTPLANNLLSLNTDGSSKLILLFGLFGVINFFLLLWVWMTNESSYYRMEQEFTELMMYLKEKTE